MSGYSGVELEDAVLGSVINNPKLYDKVCGYFIMEEVFSQTRASLLWNKITQMKKSNEHIDLKTMCSNLSKSDTCNGLNALYISGCISNASIDGTVELYARKVYEKYLLRNIVTKSYDISEKARENATDVYDVVSEAYSLFGEFLEVRPSTVTDIKDVINDTVESFNSNKTNLIKTNYNNLDKFAGGLTKGEITIIGGRPGHGKTTFMVNLLSNVLDGGLRAMFFSRELPNTELLKKIICLESGKLSYSMIRKSVFKPNEEKEINRILEVIKDKYGKDKFLMFDNIKNFSLAASEIRKFKPDIIFDDYIQLITCEGKQSERRLQIEKLVNDYKWLAKETQASVVLASQLNRAIEHREKDIPKLSDLAESGAIEQVAENVFFTFYKHKAQESANENVLIISAGKVRYGNTGTVKLGYDGDKCKIYNSEEEILNEKLPY